MIVEIQNMKLFKMLMLGLFLIMATCFAAGSAQAAAPLPVYITVEGTPVSMPVPPVISDGSMLVGVRFISEALGAKVSWDPALRQVTVSRLDTTIVLTMGQTKALVNGQAVVLAASAQIVDNHAMVPLRFIAESLGGTVEWNPVTRTANILRRPTAITGMTYLTDSGQSSVVLTLSEPLLSVTPQEKGNSLTLDLYPAVIQTANSVNTPFDGLARVFRLTADGRSVHFEAQLWHAPNYRYALSPDGLQLTITFEHTVTGVQFSQNGRMPQINIAATGRLAYTTAVLQNPDRLVVDLMGAHLDPGLPGTVPIGMPGLAQVRLSTRSSPDGVRVVVDMSGSLGYDIISTDMGLQIRFVPQIVTVQTQKLPGVTRLTLQSNLPVDAIVTAPSGKNQITVQIPQGRSAVANNLIAINDGTINAVTITPGANPNTATVTITLPYYLGHTVRSKNGDSSVVIDVVTSSVYGKRIWIDAGHGKIPGGSDDPGSIGRTYGTKEKEINLSVALALQQKLQAAGAIVYMTRTGDEGVDYHDRPSLANTLKPPLDLFISIHHNSDSTGSARGTETYYWTTNPLSAVAAKAIQPAIVKALGFSDRSVRTDDFYVIVATKAPSVLVELGFLSNPAEEKLIAEPGIVQKSYPAKAAEGIKNGVMDFFWQEIRGSVAN